MTKDFEEKLQELAIRYAEKRYKEGDSPTLITLRARSVYRDAVKELYSIIFHMGMLEGLTNSDPLESLRKAEDNGPDALKRLLEN